MPSKKPAPKEVLKMDTKPQRSTASTGKKTEVKVDAPEIDSESLVVHVDDTQNDLDADLINSKDALQMKWSSKIYFFFQTTFLEKIAVGPTYVCRLNKL
jgi:hypothetical protein